jgi:hypothetical protein
MHLPPEPDRLRLHVMATAKLAAVHDLQMTAALDAESGQRVIGVRKRTPCHVETSCQCSSAACSRACLAVVVFSADWRVADACGDQLARARHPCTSSLLSSLSQLIALLPSLLVNPSCDRSAASRSRPGLQALSLLQLAAACWRAWRSATASRGTGQWIGMLQRASASRTWVGMPSPSRTCFASS